MSQLNILQYPDPRLRIVAAPVERVNDEIRCLVGDMLETMYQAPGIGLAATQVDAHLRVIVIDISAEKDQPLVLINPELLEASGEEEVEEGCLSLPGIYEKVCRSAHIKITALGVDARSFNLETDGLLAVCIQHEMDHLLGKVFVDYLSPLKQQRTVKKLQKQQKFTHDKLVF
ncbi:MAG: peptide deformylase [Gammaproteobacteria bacterium]|nr:MAG: peptide deformylase [Gammaproteobacteria bacterium]